jgi:hypothetical protein
LDEDKEIVYWASPTEKTIYKNTFDEDTKLEMMNNIGKIEKIYENKNETSWIGGLDCNKNLDALYWFNAVCK